MSFSRLTLRPNTPQHRQFWGGLILFSLLAVTAHAVPPNPPTNLTGNFTNATRAVLTWTDNSADESMFKIDQASDAAFTANLVTYNAAVNATTISVNGLTPGATYWYRIRAFSWSLGSSANCAMNPPSGTTGVVIQDILPAPWTVHTIGSPAPLTANVAYQVTSPDLNVPKCQYTLNGSGVLSTTAADSLGSLDQTLYGDGEVVARVDGFAGSPAASAKAGVMIRESTAPGSRFAAVYLLPGTGGAQFLYRLTANATAVVGSSNTTVSPPYWVKVVRSGNSLSGYLSANTVTGNWTPLGSTITMNGAMNKAAQGGLFVCSGNTTSYAAAALSEVSLKRGGDSAPFGGGVGGYSWYGAQRPFVDLMKQSSTIQKLNTSNLALCDANGWPTEDFQTMILLPIASDLGQVYHLSANNVNANPTIGAYGELVTNKVYDSANKTVTADIVIIGVPSNVQLTMNGTNGGAKNIRIIQPGYSANTTQVFTAPLKELLKQGTAIRFMDLTCTNGNQIRGWSDRSHLTDANYSLSFNGSAKGLPWEQAVRLCNETDRDMWLNVPALADDDYITKLARLIKFGCRGCDDPNSANWYIPFASAAEYAGYAYTKYPPLKANLNVYVEHSNETWNYGFVAYSQCVAAATGYYNHDATYWHSTAGYLPDSSTFNGNGRRWHVKRLIDIRNLFVSGNGTTGPFAAEPARVRALLGLQQVGDTSGATRTDLEWVQTPEGFNSAPKNFLHSLCVTNYHGAADGYFFGDGAESRNTMTAAEVLAQVQAGANSINKNVYEVKDVGIATFYGLQMTGYEGGLAMKDDTRRFTANNIAAVHAALNDPAMATVMSTALSGWYQNGGRQFEYFTLSAGSDCGYNVTDDILNLASPRIAGINSVLTAAPPTVNIGYVADNVNGARITPRALDPVTDSAVEISGAAYLETASAGQGPLSDTIYRYFRGSGPSRGHYLINAAAAGSYALKLNVSRSATIDQTFDVAVNNVTVASNLTVAHSTSGWVDSPSATISLNAGLNTIRVLATGVTDSNINSLKLLAAGSTGNLVTWNMDTVSGSAAPAPPNYLATGLSSSNLTITANLSRQNWNNCFGFSRGHETSLQNAYTNNRYATFTVTPTGGSTVTINSVSVFAFSRNGGGNYTLEASAGSGFGYGAGNDLGTWRCTADSTSPAAYTFTLGTPIVTTAPVEFRFYIWGSASQYNEWGFGKVNATDGKIDLAVAGSVQTSGNLTQTMPFFSSGMPSATTKALNTAHTFTLSPYDAETAAGSLTVTANSTNQTLVPNGNIVITGSGNTTRPVTITPAANQYGRTRINLTVSDGTLSRTAYYDLTVTPTLTGNQSLLSTGASGGASGLSDPVNGIRANLAFDGNLDTSWISPATGFTFNGTWDNNGVTGGTCATQGHWVYVNLGALKHVERVKIIFGTNYARSFKLQYPHISPTDGYTTPIWYDLPGAPVFTGNNTQQTVDITGLNTNQQYLRLFVSERNSTGSGVEVKEFEVYGTPPLTTNTKINCGQTSGTPPTGWSLDDGYSAGSTADRGAGLTWDKSAVPAPVPDDNVYRYERYGACIYTVGGLTPGAGKTVRLHFAESYCTAAGQRLFHVKINGTQVLTSFDIYAAAGAQHKAVERNFAATVNADGKITIELINATGNAQLNGFEVN